MDQDKRDSGPGGKRSTRLSLQQLRADAVHRVLLSPPGRGCLTAEDIPLLEALRSWPSAVLGAAIDRLVADGILTDDEHGRIHVAPHPAADAMPERGT